MTNVREDPQVWMELKPIFDKPLSARADFSEQLSAKVFDAPQTEREFTEVMSPEFLVKFETYKSYSRKYEKLCTFCY